MSVLSGCNRLTYGVVFTFNRSLHRSMISPAFAFALEGSDLSGNLGNRGWALTPKSLVISENPSVLYKEAAVDGLGARPDDGVLGRR